MTGGQVRGVLGLVVGAGMLWATVVWPDGFNDAPLWIRLVFGGFGAVAIIAGLASLQHDRRRTEALRDTVPVQAGIRIAKVEDDESSYYYAFVTVGSEKWRVPLAGGKADRALAGTAGEGRVWFSPDTGLPIAVEYEGRQLSTIPTANKVPTT